MEERLNAILSLINDNPGISHAAMAAKLEFTEAQVKTAAINELKNRKIIYH